MFHTGRKLSCLRLFLYSNLLDFDAAVSKTCYVSRYVKHL